MLHDKVYRAPNRASGNTKSIHRDVREQYLKQKRDEYFNSYLDENPLPSLDDLTASAPHKIIKNYFKLNPREPVTNTEKTKKEQEEMSRQLREYGFGHKYWPVTKQKIDPETVLRTKRRNKGGRKNKTRRKKRTRRRRKKRLKKKNRKKRTKRR